MIDYRGQSRTDLEVRFMAVAEITDASFESEVLKADKPVIVDFWAPWCVPTGHTAARPWTILPGSNPSDLGRTADHSPRAPSPMTATP